MFCKPWWFFKFCTQVLITGFWSQILVLSLLQIFTTVYIMEEWIQQPCKKQITSLLFEEFAFITRNISHVHYQPNYVNCGMSAIAFLVSLLFNHDPATVTYCEGTMGFHLLKSLNDDRFTPFPLARNQKRVFKKNHQRKILNCHWCATVVCRGMRRILMTQISGAPSVRNARKMSSGNVQNVQSKLLNIYWLKL